MMGLFTTLRTISVFLQGNLSCFPFLHYKSTDCVFSPPLLTSKGGSFEPLEPPLLRACRLVESGYINSLNRSG